MLLNVVIAWKTSAKPLILQDGGAEGSRTPDLLIANETLYQLSYDPIPPTVTHVKSLHRRPRQARKIQSRDGIPSCAAEPEIREGPKQLMPLRRTEGAKKRKP